jgi:uncharacterized membrane protein
MEKIKQLFVLTGFSEKEKNELGFNRLTKLMLELSAGCLVLLIMRCWRTHNISYVFLTWNLFLAWVPVIIAKYFISDTPFRKNKFTALFAIGAWLAFLPNAPYLLTDLFHLHKSPIVPQWYDLILILSFALTGMVLFYLSFLEFEKKVYPELPHKFVRWIRMLIFIAVGYGLYLGRYLRYNSWDIISDPADLVKGMFNSVFSQNMVKETLGVTFFFAVFLYFGYKLFFLITDRKITRE